MRLIRNILVGVDLDEVSERALDYAIALSAELDAHLTVVHSYAIPVLNALDAEYIPTADAAAQKAEFHRTRLDALVTPRKAAGAKLTEMLRVGSAPEEVCAVAKERNADLIVVGTHGRGAVGRILLGSVAQAVIRDASVPVLTVK